MKKTNSERIKIGFIGLNPDSHWASKAHLPALKFLTEYFEITGVANSTYESAKRSADALKIPIAFQNSSELIQSPEIDLVVITVKVPHHFNLVKEALEAGKHVYCEHPLGNGLKETIELAELAVSKNLVAVVGLQMTVSPEVIYLQQLIKDGFVGKVLSTTLIGSGGSWRDSSSADQYYMFDKSNGATMLSIPLGHTLSGLIKVLGEFDELKAQMTSNYNTVNIVDTGDVKPKTTEDQIMIIGKLKSGAAISVHYRGGVSKGTNLLWEINGSEGDIQVTGMLGHGQFVPLSIRGANGNEKELRVLTPLPEVYEGFPDDVMSRNVANIYSRLAADIRSNTRTAPTFTDAVMIQELLNSIENASKQE
jgi:predicted dehydrogenase